MLQKKICINCEGQQKWLQYLWSSHKMIAVIVELHNNNCSHCKGHWKLLQPLWSSKRMIAVIVEFQYINCILWSSIKIIAAIVELHKNDCSYCGATLKQLQQLQKINKKSCSHYGAPQNSSRYCKAPQKMFAAIADIIYIATKWKGMWRDHFPF